MNNVKQMLSVMAKSKVPGGGGTNHELASLKIDTTDPPGLAFRTRLTVLFTTEFRGPAGVHLLRLTIDGVDLTPVFQLGTESTTTESRTFVAFRDGFRTGTHEVRAVLRRGRPPDGIVGVRTLTVWETVVPRKQSAPRGRVLGPVA
jgi:hypothetical protein